MSKIKKFSILTLFPQLFNDFINTSIIKKALNNQKISIEIFDIRQFADNKHQQVDDYPYGGGAGMVLQALPVIKAIKAAKKTNRNALVIFLSPQGKTWNQSLAYEKAQAKNNYIFLCGHYEGIDERVMQFVDEEISVGDYVLTGGELPAMILVDSITRLLAEVISNDSHVNDSFNDNLLDYPSYTRPEVVLNMAVPEVLLSGNHQKIAQYRREQALINTYKKRPDLLEKSHLSDKEKIWIENYFRKEKNKS